MHHARLHHRLALLGALACLAASAATAIGTGFSWPLSLLALGLVSALVATHLRFNHQALLERRRTSEQQSLFAAVAHRFDVVDAGMTELREILQHLNVSSTKSSELLRDIARDQTDHAQLTHQSLADIRQATQIMDTGATSALDSVADAHRDLRAKLGTEMRITRKSVVDQAGELRKMIEQLPSSVDEYSELRRRLAEGMSDLPRLGGWALTSPMVASITRAILASDRPVTVLELGSGGSSEWVGLALKASEHQGHCWALEQENENAARTRQRLLSAGVSDFVTVLDAPLVDIQMNDGTYEWYDVAALPDTPLTIDLLLVDGPRGKPGEQVRYPAVPTFRQLLAPGAWIYLDDTIRQIEKDILQRWLAENPELTVVEELGKGTALRWGSPD